MASNDPDGLTPRAREIRDAARKILETEGAEAVSMRRVAQALGIKAPSIYKHFPDKDALEAGIISAAFDEQAVAFQAALEGSEDPLWTLAQIYRQYAREHPHLYRLMTEKALRRDLLEPGSEQRGAALLLEVAGQDQDYARAIWAFAHGMTILELNNRFPPDADLDAAWTRGIDAFRRAAERR